ncbi:MAG: hypothetical protein ACJAX5_000057 [Patiriisocius sp.]
MHQSLEIELAPNDMNFPKITVIALLLATAIFAQAMSAVDHVHLDVVGEQACLICGSSASDALLYADVIPAVVPAESFLVRANVQPLHQRPVLDLRSRAPPISLAT